MEQKTAGTGLETRGCKRNYELSESEGSEPEYKREEGSLKRRKTSRDDSCGSASQSLSSHAVRTPRQSMLPTPKPSNLTDICDTKDVKELQETESLDMEEVFPFMKLPAELRVHIYRMALQRDEPLLLHLQRPAEAEEDKSGIRTTNSGRVVFCVHFPRPRPSRSTGASITTMKDGINPALLRTCSLIYKEARQVLYSDNTFTLSLTSGIYTLANLHQRSRSLIKSVSLTIPSHHDILDGFADLVRLGLRYCWGLKKFTIVLQAAFPDDRMIRGATSVYANAFHILRWLPKGCKVVLEGNVSEVVRRVVVEEGRLQEELDETSYLRRQHQIPERH